MNAPLQHRDESLAAPPCVAYPWRESDGFWPWTRRNESGELVAFCFELPDGTWGWSALGQRDETSFKRLETAKKRVDRYLRLRGWALEKFSSRIPIREEYLLQNYFSKWLSYASFPSRMGVQLDQMKLYGDPALPCLDCGGDRERDIVGTGFVTAGYDYKLELILAGVDGHVDPPMDMICGKCEGLGVVSGRRRRGQKLTAQPKKSHSSGIPDVMRDSDSLLDLARISRNLAKIHFETPALRACLEAYYSPDGGSAAALWQFTDVGQQLLRGNERGLTPNRFLDALREAQEKNKSVEQAALFQRADAAANHLFELMHHTYCRLLEAA